MTGLEIVQKGDPILARRDLVPFVLPADHAQAARVVERLSKKAEEVEERYLFKHGTGLAAPQIGIACRAALVRLPNGARPIVLLNPTVVDRGPDESTKFFEGCLS